MIFYIPGAKLLQCDHSNESPKSKKFQRFLQIAKQLVRCEVKTKTDLGWGQNKLLLRIRFSKNFQLSYTDSDFFSGC